MTIRTLLIGLTFAMSLSTATAQSGVVPAANREPQPMSLTFVDQFDRKADLSSLRGRVVILVYGDRKGTDACREYGEQLHTLFHPAAKGQPPEKARLAPVVPLAGVPAGQPSPEVVVVPVACVGKVPGPVKALVRTGVAKASPVVTVWLDFTGVMADTFGITAGEPNLVVFDAAGKLRHSVSGTPDEAAGAKLLQTIQNLRAEAAGLGK